MTSDAYHMRNRAELIRGGKPYFDRLHEMVAGARQTIHLQFYIYADDETGRSLREALEAAAARGVAVFLHVDGYASQKLSKSYIRNLQEKGIRFKWFNPVFRSRKFYFGRRMHHKVVVVDGLYSLVGGVNISDRYNDLPGKPSWLDMAVYCEGEVSLELHQLCRKMWGAGAIAGPVNLERAGDFFAGIPEKDRISVRLRRNDWVKRKREITKSYLYMFLHAEKEILIMCSYFLPGRAIRRTLRKAAGRGVRIRVILAGHSDVMVAKHAERHLYDWLLKYQVEIYEYQRTVLHAKLATYDQRWVTAGSYNVNNISDYASLEVNFDIRNRPFAESTQKVLEQIIAQDCVAVTPANYKAYTGFFRRLWQRICYSFVSTMLSLFTFYFKQEE